MQRPRCPCPRCGKIVVAYSGGGPIVHKCPHGVRCVYPGYPKLGQSFGEDCSVCAAERAERQARTERQSP